MGVAERFGGRRGLQVAVLTAALLVVLAFLALDTLGRPQATRSVWVTTRSVNAGGALDSSAVRSVNIPVGSGAFAYLAGSPNGKFASHALSSGDILREDDVEGLPLVAVPVRLGGYQAAPGDTIDIYEVDGGKATMIGRGITVLSGSTIQVPASDEPLWIAIYGSSATLIGARSNGTGVPDAAGMSGADAARRLSVLARDGGTVAQSPAP